MRLFILFFITTAGALHCDKVFNYYDNYGNGFDVTCQGITSEYIHILQNITISQEISLTIENSNITNGHSDLFKRISQLKYLFIYNSVFNFPPTEQVFKYLNQLVHLEIKNTALHVSKHTFTGLDSLKDLIMSNNSISNIEEDSFEDLKNLRKFELTLNNVDNIENLPLCEITDLDYLNLSRNSINTLELPNFHCKSSSESFNFKLNDQKHTLNLPVTNYENVSDYGMQLTHIDLSYNKIKGIGDALANLKFIQTLRLQGNALTQLKHSDLRSLNDLEVIYLENNNLKIMEEDVFKDKLNLRYIDVSYNQLEKFVLGELPLLDYLNLAHNQLSKIKINHVKTMKSIRILLLNNNKFSSFKSHEFQYFSSLEILDLGDNMVQLNEQSLNGLTMLKTINLRNNSIEILSSNVFSSLTHLKTLDLSHNNLKILTFNKTFQYLGNLETLNISYNSIDLLNYDIFEPLNNLRVLDISGNKLKEIQYELILSNLKFLSVLDIKSNLLSCEMLSTIIQYLKTRNVTYTMAEKISYERENIGGIYCTSSKTSLSVVNVPSSSSSILTNMSIVVSIILVVIIISVLMFKVYIYLKRRRYCPDEFELING